MPIYEFYCEDCHTVFNFFSKRVNTEKRPACPRCGRPELERQVSLFAISKNRTDDAGDEMPDLDEERLQQVMGSLEAEMGSVDENDPRQMAQMMRRLYDATGLNMTDGVAEAVQRLEAGEDPDRIEEEMGDVFEGEDPFAGPKKGLVKDLRRRLLPPRVDETLYDL